MNPIVIAPRTNNDICVCMDPGVLNVYIKRALFHIPTKDEIFTQLSGACCFICIFTSRYCSKGLNLNSYPLLF